MVSETDKRYYWLKLKKDFFKRHDIKIIENMPNGKDYVLFYLKLLLESIDHEGNLRFSDTIPYNEQMLATVTDTNVDIVKSALNIFRELGLVDVFDDQTLYMTEVEKMTGSETAWAVKKREYKKRNDELKEEKVGKISSQSPDNFQTISDKSKSKSKSIELDKELEIEKDIKESDTNVSPKKSSGETALIEAMSKYNISDYLFDYLFNWIEYKKERNFRYKDRGLNTLIKTIGEKARQYGDEAVAKVIDESISNGYQGILWDRIGKQAKSKGERDILHEWRDA